MPITADYARDFGFPESAFEALIDIEPHSQSKNASCHQTGELKITLPGPQEQTEGLAYWLGRRIVQQISFTQQAEMRIHYGLVGGELVPETPEEIAELGENRYFAKVQLVEAPPVPEFDGDRLSNLSNNPLVIQFNVADRAENAIDRFLGLFKILEDRYGPNKPNVKLADALRSSKELFDLASTLLVVDNKTGVETKLSEKKEYDDLVVKLVKMRHECAHLLSGKKFGVPYGDSRVKTEVEPLLPALSALAFLTVEAQS